MSNEKPSTNVAPPPPSAGPEPHLFDRLSVLYKYRWAAITVFALVVGWVMVDSYTRIPVYKAVARVLIEDPNADIATPTEIARNITLADPEIYQQTQPKNGHGAADAHPHLGTLTGDPDNGHEGQAQANHDDPGGQRPR